MMYIIYCTQALIRLIDQTVPSVYTALHIDVENVFLTFSFLSRFFAFLTFLPRCMECRRGLAMRILSVCLSVTRVDCDKTVERSVQIFIPYERTFSLVFWEEWVVGGRPLLPEILGQLARVGEKSPFFNQ